MCRSKEGGGDGPRQARASLGEKGRAPLLPGPRAARGEPRSSPTAPAKSWTRQTVVKWLPRPAGLVARTSILGLPGHGAPGRGCEWGIHFRSGACGGSGGGGGGGGSGGGTAPRTDRRTNRPSEGGTSETSPARRSRPSGGCWALPRAAGRSAPRRPLASASSRARGAGPGAGFGEGKRETTEPPRDSKCEERCSHACCSRCPRGTLPLPRPGGWALGRRKDWGWGRAVGEQAAGLGASVPWAAEPPPGTGAPRGLGVGV